MNRVDGSYAGKIGTFTKGHSSDYFCTGRQQHFVEAGFSGRSSIRIKRVGRNFIGFTAGVGHYSCGVEFQDSQFGQLIAQGDKVATVDGAIYPEVGEGASFGSA